MIRVDEVQVLNGRRSRHPLGLIVLGASFLVMVPEILRNAASRAARGKILLKAFATYGGYDAPSVKAGRQLLFSK